MKVSCYIYIHSQQNVCEQGSRQKQLGGSSPLLKQTKWAQNLPPALCVWGITGSSPLHGQQPGRVRMHRHWHSYSTDDLMCSACRKDIRRLLAIPSTIQGGMGLRMCSSIFLVCLLFRGMIVYAIPKSDLNFDYFFFSCLLAFQRAYHAHLQQCSCTVHMCNFHDSPLAHLTQMKTDFCFERINVCAHSRSRSTMRMRKLSSSFPD